ncbi:MAG: 16S rRNA (cytidine(1402)-2'-O)-methyltransferase [Alphaproteobacteria bacterium]|nr:16S rRNA (cytidine(1402)-2'-O)-methyltransferase [Alphaproteobacteria bacterium]
MQKPAQEKTREEFEAGLYLVATPIGNLQDMTLRAINVLNVCDYVLCEDMRVSRKLFSAYGIKVETKIYNDHSDEQKRQRIIEELNTGKMIALVTDAGSPLISDPGYKLVREVRKQGIYVTTIPGACAPVAAMQISGLPSDKFSFLGFLPSKTQARKKILEEWAAVPSTLVAFESASRLLATLHDIGAVMGKRYVAVIREITKIYEEVQSGEIEQLIEYYKDSGTPKGEIVLVIAPPEVRSFSDVILREMLREQMVLNSTKDAVALVSQRTGMARKHIYDLALGLAKEGDDVS